jgi:hypothetical protein
VNDETSNETQPDEIREFDAPPLRNDDIPFRAGLMDAEGKPVAEEIGPTATAAQLEDAIPTRAGESKKEAKS